KSDKLGDHAVGMLELHPTNQLWNFVERAEGSGPIGHRKPGVIAGDQGPRDDQKQSSAGHKYRKPVMRAIVRRRRYLQTNSLWITSAYGKGSGTGRRPVPHANYCLND